MNILLILAFYFLRLDSSGCSDICPQEYIRKKLLKSILSNITSAEIILLDQLLP